jgi:flagellar biosynthesis chaperone FliJ
MSKPQYPLEQLTLIKQKKLEEAEKNLKEKKIAYDKEKEKLETLEKDRDKVKFHRDDKLNQLRQKLDEGTTTDKIQQMKIYLKEVDDKLKVKENKVKDQVKVVDAAEKKVAEARIEMIKRQQDMEKMRLHREEWEKEMKIIEDHKESLEMDETGSSMFSRKKSQSSKGRKEKS